MMTPETLLKDLALDPAQLTKPLSEDEQDQLAELLADTDFPDTTMTMEELDGFFCALAVGPHVGANALTVADWVPCVFGEDDLPKWKTPAAAKAFFTLLLRHHAAVRAALHLPKAQITDANMYMPWAYEIDDADRVLPVTLEKSGLRRGEWFGRWWAAGFGVAIAEWQEDWQAMLDDEDASELVDPFIRLEKGYDELDPKAPFDEDNALMDCIAAAYEMQRWWQIKNTPVAQRRSTGEPGRNDACPCGSGKKFKKCCGAQAD